jgi:restriction endonuclease S subunit
MASVSPIQVTNFRELERWDVKYFTERIVSKYPLVSLSEIVYEHNEEIRPLEYPDQSFKILGVNNTVGIFHAYDTLGKKIKQPYKKLSAGDFAYNPYRINVGSIGLVPDEHDNGYISPAYVVFGVDKLKFIPEILLFILKSDFFNKTLRAATAGSVRMNLTYPLLQTLRVPFAPLLVQERIIDYWKAVQGEVSEANQSYLKLVDKLNQYLIQNIRGYRRLKNSRVFVASYSKAQQWDVKAGRSAALRTANPEFVSLGEFTEECTELFRPWEEPEKEWPIYGANNKDSVFLNVYQKGKDFNAPYKRIKKNCFFHNPTRANVGSLGIVPEVPYDAITSPEYQVWRLHSGFLPEFMALMIRTEYFLSLVDFNRVGGVKQRMYYANLAEIRLPRIDLEIQKEYADRRMAILSTISKANESVKKRRAEIEEMILGLRPVEGT